MQGDGVGVQPLRNNPDLKCLRFPAARLSGDGRDSPTPFQLSLNHSLLTVSARRMQHGETLSVLTKRADNPQRQHARRRSVLFQVTPSTGEPDAGNPPVRFGGRGDSNQ